MVFRRDQCIYCGQENHISKGKWTNEEDERLLKFMETQDYSVSRWRDVPRRTGILRCSNSCRARWYNYLRPDVIQGSFTTEEDIKIVKLYRIFGDQWSLIADHLPGRTSRIVRDHCITRRMQRVLNGAAGAGWQYQQNNQRRGRRPNKNVNLELTLKPPEHTPNLNLELTLKPPVNTDH